jgi:hypothetical protein
MLRDHHFSKSAVTSTWIHWLNLERLNLERLNLERLNLEWTEPRMDPTPNGLNPEWNWTLNGTNPEWDWTPNGTEPWMGLNSEWTEPRMDWTPNGLNHEHFPLNPFKKRAALGWVWTQEWYSTLTFLSTPRIWCTMCQGVHSIYQKNGFKNYKNVLYCNNWNGPIWGWKEFTGWVRFFGVKSVLCWVPFIYSYSYITLLY